MALKVWISAPLPPSVSLPSWAPVQEQCNRDSGSLSSGGQDWADSSKWLHWWLRLVVTHIGNPLVRIYISCFLLPTVWSKWCLSDGLLQWERDYLHHNGCLSNPSAATLKEDVPTISASMLVLMICQQCLTSGSLDVLVEALSRYNLHQVQSYLSS